MAVANKSVELAEREDAAYDRFRTLARTGEFAQTDGVSTGIQALRQRVRKTLASEYVDLDSPTESSLFSRSSALMKHLDAEAAREARGATIPVERVEALRRLINHTVEGATDRADRRVALLVKSAFNEYLSEDVPRLVAPSGAAAADVLGDALEVSRAYRGAFHHPIVQKLLDPDLSSKDAFRELFGDGHGIVARRRAVAAIRGLKNVVGEDHEAVRNIQSVAIRRLTGGVEAALRTGQPPPFSQTAERIRLFLTQQKELAEALLSPQQIEDLGNIEKVMRLVQPARRSATSPGSGPVIARSLAGIAARATAQSGVFSALGGEARNLLAARQVRRELRANPPKPPTLRELIGGVIGGALSAPAPRIPRPGLIGGIGGLKASTDHAPLYYQEDVYGNALRR